VKNELNDWTVMKICRDCKFYTETYHGAPYCRAQPEVIENPVTGPKYNFIKCTDRRDTLGKCGPQGLLFEPKLGKKIGNLWEKIFG
jgi:hypothetical protein